MSIGSCSVSSCAGSGAQQPVQQLKPDFQAEWPDRNALTQTRFSYSGHAARAAASLMTLGLAPLGVYGLKKLVPKLVMPALSFSDELCSEFSHHADTWVKAAVAAGRVVAVERLSLRTPDGALIDSRAMTLPSQQGLPPEEQRWIIYFCGNGDLYERQMEFAHEYGERVGANVLLFNYRGVGQSQGFPMRPEELVLDGETVMQYLLNHVGVASEHVLVHGISLGAAVGTQVRKLHPDGSIINERSFSSLTKEVSTIISPIAGKLLYQIRWELDSAAVWSEITGRKVIVFHKEDGVIPYPASLYKSVMERHATGPDDVVIDEAGREEFDQIHVQLRDVFFENGLEGRQAIEPHNVPLRYHKAEWEAIVQIARQILHP